MEELTRIIRLLEDELYGHITLDQLRILFQGVDEGVEIYPGFVRRYIELGPQDERRTFFLDRALAISRQTMEMRLSHAGLYVFVATHGAIPKARAMGVWDQIVRDSPENPGRWPTFTVCVCIRCRDRTSYPMLSVLKLSRPVKPSDLLFDPTFLSTRDGIRAIMQLAPERFSEDEYLIAGLCQECNNPCTCGIKLTPSASREDLLSFVSDGVCSQCGGNSLAKLQLPKPSPKELKIYHNKLRDLRKG